MSSIATAIQFGDGLGVTDLGSGTIRVDANAAPGALTEIGYDQITTSVNVTATSEAAGTPVISCAPHVFDGTPVIFEFFSTSVQPAAAVQAWGALMLFEGLTEIGQIAFIRNPAAALSNTPVYARVRFTPTAGTHTYTVTGIQSGGAMSVAAGPGGTATGAPAYVRFSKAAGTAGPKGDPGAPGAGIPTPVVNGQWIYGSGGAAVWKAIAPADLGTGTPSTTTFLRGDGSWQAPPGGLPGGQTASSYLRSNASNVAGWQPVPIPQTDMPAVWGVTLPYPPNNDWNQTAATGNYMGHSSNTTNGPWSSYGGWWLCYCQNYGSGWQTQRAVAMDQAQSATAAREQKSGTWSAWRYLNPGPHLVISGDTNGTITAQRGAGGASCAKIQAGVYRVTWTTPCAGTVFGFATAQTGNVTPLSVQVLGQTQAQVIAYAGNYVDAPWAMVIFDGGLMW